MRKHITYLFLVATCLSLSVQSPGQVAGFEGVELVQLSNGKSWTSGVEFSVYNTLLKNHVIRDPYQGMQEDSLKWISETTWEYRLTRNYTPIESYKHIDLVIDNISTDADVMVNSTKVLSCHNQFRQYVVNVKPYLRGKNDTVVIRLYPSSAREKAQANLLKDTLPGGERVFTRKAAYQYGWDFGPRFLDMGIGHTYLHTWNTMYIDDAWVRTLKADTAKARLEINMDIYCEQTGNYEISCKIDADPELDTLLTCSLKKGMNTLRFRQTMLHPNLWWCNGYGHHAMTDLDIEVSNSKGASAKTHKRFGIRTIELVQAGKPDSTGFEFRLNGVPVFVKGANVIPGSSFGFPYDNDTRYHIPLQASVMNMNMLRIWGGGVYPDESFMMECDAKGIMVWQDLMFACAMYPGDTAFVNNVSEEVKYQVRRLRGHPSLALWCGNNEIEEGWYNWDWQKQYHYTAADSARIWGDYLHLFRKVIPGIIHQLDPGHAYWPSSPSNGWGHAESMAKGDAHYWGVWWGKEPFSVYETKVPRFMSEYGFQSLPDISTWKTCCPDSMLYIGSPCLKAHQKHPTGYETIDTYLTRDLVVPQNLEDYIYASQFLQAWGIGKAIEAQRRARPYCMGTLFWQLNDCWPGATWSALDYYGKRKYLYHQVQRLYQPQLISGYVKDRRFYIALINDQQKSDHGDLKIVLKKLDGHVVWSKAMTIEMPTAGVTHAWSFPVDSLLGNDSTAVYIDMQMTIDKSQLHRINYLVSPGSLKLQEPHIKVRYVDRGFMLSTDQLALGVRLDRIKDYNVTIAENFLDLQPGEEVMVYDDNAPSKNNGWKFYSLYDLLKSPKREPLKK